MQGGCNLSAFLFIQQYFHELLSLPVTASQYSSLLQASSEQDVFCTETNEKCRDSQRDFPLLYMYVFNIWWDHSVVSLARYFTQVTVPLSAQDDKINGYCKRKLTCIIFMCHPSQYVEVAVHNTLFLTLVQCRL